MSEQDRKTEKTHCNSCGQKTTHSLVANRVQNGSEEFDGMYSVDWRYTYSMLECCGCESVCLRREFWFSEAPGEVAVEFFPPRVSRRKPKWADDLPGEVSDLLTEVYVALHADSRRLAMMGARALIDLVSQRRVGDVGGFKDKMEALVNEGYLSSRNRAVLEAAIDTGHAAVHRGHKVTAVEANQTMDIVENLLQADLLEEVAGSLRRSVPERSGPSGLPRKKEGRK